MRVAWRSGVAILGVMTLALLVATSGARAHLASLAAPISHADPVWIDRLPELPAPRGALAVHRLSAEARAAATPVTLLGVLPGLWCGTRRSSDDTAHELQNGTYSYHAIYAVPAGATDRFSTVAGTLQADAFQASSLLERLYNRSIRFDMGTDCGAQYLDISVVALPQTAAALSALAGRSSSALLQEVSDALARAGFDLLPAATTSDEAAAKRKNYLVWLEGVTAGAGICGVGTQFDDTRRDFSNFNNFGGKLALVMRDGAQFCNSNTVRHEIGHNLGALLPGSPSAFDGAHCDDAYEDTMCYPQSPRRADGDYQNLYFDFGNNDYWDPAGGALPRWTVNLSRFLCPNIVCNVPSDSSLTGKLVGSILGGVGGLVQDFIVSCPEGQTLGPEFSCKGNAGSSTTGVGRHATPTPRIVFTAKRSGKGRWRIAARLSGGGRALLTVRCRRHGRRVRVLQRRLSGRRTLRATVRCDSRPRGSGRTV